MQPAGLVKIGISGWTYAPWRGVFYPEDLPHKRELTYASGVLNSIEINGTFYSMQRPGSFARWAEETPDDFVFSIKGPRYLTHIRRLKDAEQPLANFLSSGLLALGRKLGPILWQLPPNFRYQPELLEQFFELLPHDTVEAASLALKHDDWMEGRSLCEPALQQPVRHAIEVRNKSFAVPEFIALARKYRVAIVCADTVEWPRMMDVTADFMYCRLHGSEELYASGYTDEALDQWADRVVAWAHGTEPDDAERVSQENPVESKSRDVFVYFDNDLKVRAPFDAQGLQRRVDKLLTQAGVVSRE
ncbi:MAG TPA: DUF72 domain-containing protein [Acidisarcina sp.]|nr:DUF72 domain-containing protein [Acidisarcina sp.]